MEAGVLEGMRMRGERRQVMSGQVRHVAVSVAQMALQRRMREVRGDVRGVWREMRRVRGQMGVRVRVSERRGNSSGAVLSLALTVCVLHLLLLLTPLLAEFFEFCILQKVYQHTCALYG